MSPRETMVDPTQRPPCGGGGASNNSDRDANNNNSDGDAKNSGRGSGFTMPPLPGFRTDNNFNGGFSYGRGDPNNNLLGSGYGYPFDGGYSNS